MSWRFHQCQDLLDKMGNAREQEVEGAEEPPEANGASVCRFQNGEDREQEPSVAGPVPEEEASGLLGKRCMSSNGIPGEPRLGIVGAPAASAASRDPQLVGSGQAIEGPKRPLCLRQLVRKVEVDPGTRPPPLYHPIRL